ncbi:hypothetical protein [Halovivax limisalsi]|uniref:hypothetical protein n=1 Tax=Halovivax limisalsi TaxID=1453760 RepID=UPI001FFD8C01|nr:hypothetical protein [Halovivax limisalsi]
MSTKDGRRKLMKRIAFTASGASLVGNVAAKDIRHADHDDFEEVDTYDEETEYGYQKYTANGGDDLVDEIITGTSIHLIEILENEYDGYLCKFRVGFCARNGKQTIELGYQGSKIKATDGDLWISTSPDLVGHYPPITDQSSNIANDIAYTVLKGAAGVAYGSGATAGIVATEVVTTAAFADGQEKYDNSAKYEWDYLGDWGTKGDSAHEIGHHFEFRIEHHKDINPKFELSQYAEYWDSGGKCRPFDDDWYCGGPDPEEDNNVAWTNKEYKAVIMGDNNGIITDAHRQKLPQEEIANDTHLQEFANGGDLYRVIPQEPIVVKNTK